MSIDFEKINKMSTNVNSKRNKNILYMVIFFKLDLNNRKNIKKR